MELWRNYGTWYISLKKKTEVGVLLPVVDLSEESPFFRRRRNTGIEPQGFGGLAF